MKTPSKKTDNQLYNLFKELFSNEDEINQAVKDAKITFSMLQQDAVYRERFLSDEP
ncbi:MAG TPA: hypothetical protein VKG26_09925 [Bacteroidia bacterium]|nr:hypothetical protein [Bacteroidia bacterium]